MKQSLMAAAFVLAGAGFALPTQVSAAPVSAAQIGAGVDQANSMTVDVRDHRHYRRGGGRHYHHRHHYSHRHWHHRPHYGRIVGGIALGALLAGSAYYAYNAPPAPGLCWYWADPYERRGYWDYC